MRPRARHEDVVAHGHVSRRQHPLAPNLACEGVGTLNGIYFFTLSIGDDDGRGHVD